MKLSITQIVLGILIIFGACYVIGWMIHEAPLQFKQPVPNDAGGVTYVDVVPENEALFNIARYGSYFLPVLGILVLIIATVQSARAGARTRSLMITNIIAGVLVAALALIITNGGYPTTFHAIMPAGSDTSLTILTNPGRSLLGVQSATYALFLLGLAVCGIGIAQYVKSLKTPTIQI
jgi:hypothetical protein